MPPIESFPPQADSGWFHSDQETDHSIETFEICKPLSAPQFSRGWSDHRLTQGLVATRNARTIYVVVLVPEFGATYYRDEVQLDADP